MWPIYSKRCEFMVYTFICAFWKIKFFWLLRPSKSSGAFKEDPTFGFLTFEYALKTRPWADCFKDIVLYLLTTELIESSTNFCWLLFEFSFFEFCFGMARNLASKCKIRAQSHEMYSTKIAFLCSYLKQTDWPFT